jgi:hypothetical protein
MDLLFIRGRDYGDIIEKYKHKIINNSTISYIKHFKTLHQYDNLNNIDSELILNLMSNKINVVDADRQDELYTGYTYLVIKAKGALKEYWHWMLTKKGITPETLEVNRRIIQQLNNTSFYELCLYNMPRDAEWLYNNSSLRNKPDTNILDDIGEILIECKYIEVLAWLQWVNGPKTNEYVPVHEKWKSRKYGAMRSQSVKLKDNE